MIVLGLPGGSCIKRKINMIKAKHNLFYVWFFRFYSKFMLKRHFSNVKLKGSYTEKNLPVLLIGNHFSWWDGFIANYLNNLIFKRKFHVMMLEEQLKSRLFLNKAGAYSIKKDSRDIVKSLNYTKELLTSTNNLVTIYPQGEIQSLYHYPLKFEKGISSVLKKLDNEVDIVFLVSLVDYFSNRKPNLTIGFQEYKNGKKGDTGDIEKHYNEFMKHLISEQKENNI